MLHIQDSGVSVRKRVIKILRDICINMPNFPKLTDCHIKLLRRISDEEGIKVSMHMVFVVVYTNDVCNSYLLLELSTSCGLLILELLRRRRL